MPIENYNYLDSLNPSFPTGTDGIVGGDDHIRGIKSTLQRTFPNLKGEVSGTHDELNTAADYVNNGTPKLADSGAKFKTNTLDGFENPSAGKVSVTASDGATTPAKQTIVEFTGSDKKASFKGPVSAVSYLGGTGQLVPIGGSLLWFEDTLPAEGGYAWANGQIIANANTVCPALLARWGNKFGGNGVTTMGLPDLREVTPVGKSTMGGTAARGILSNIATSLITAIGSLFGESAHTLTNAEIPPHTHPTSESPHSHLYSAPARKDYEAPGGAQAGIGVLWGGGSVNTNTTGSTTGLTVGANTGGGGSHNNVQPSTAVNYIIRIG